MNNNFGYSASDFNNLRAHQEQYEVTNYSERGADSLAPFSRVMSSQNALCVQQGANPNTRHVVVRQCRACGDIVVGTSINCAVCAHNVHSHCVVRSHGGTLMCSACATELEYVRGQGMAQSRLAAASVSLGRFAGAGGQLVGQAAGAVVTGAVGGVLRLASGAAHGIRDTTAGLQMTQTPSPVRPRVLELTEERTVSEAGSQEAVTATASHSNHNDNGFENQVMEQLRAMQERMNHLESENQRLRQRKTTRQRRYLKNNSWRTQVERSWRQTRTARQQVGRTW